MWCSLIFIWSWCCCCVNIQPKEKKQECGAALPSMCLFLPPSPQYQYKKNYEKSKGHYHTIPDNLEQLHLKEATELQSIVSWPRLSFFLHIHLPCPKFSWIPLEDSSYTCSNKCSWKFPKISGAWNLATCWNKCSCYEW